MTEYPEPKKKLKSLNNSNNSLISWIENEKCRIGWNCLWIGHVYRSLFQFLRQIAIIGFLFIGEHLLIIHLHVF